MPAALTGQLANLPLDQLGNGLPSQSTVSTLAWGKVDKFREREISFGFTDYLRAFCKIQVFFLFYKGAEFFLFFYNEPFPQKLLAL